MIEYTADEICLISLMWRNVSTLDNDYFLRYFQPGNLSSSLEQKNKRPSINDHFCYWIWLIFLEITFIVNNFHIFMRTPPYGGLHWWNLHPYLFSRRGVGVVDKIWSNRSYSCNISIKEGPISKAQFSEMTNESWFFFATQNRLVLLEFLIVKAVK